MVKLKEILTILKRDLACQISFPKSLSFLPPLVLIFCTMARYFQLHGGVSRFRSPCEDVVGAELCQSSSMSHPHSHCVCVCVREGLQGKCWHLGLKQRLFYPCLPHWNSFIKLNDASVSLAVTLMLEGTLSVYMCSMADRIHLRPDCHFVAFLSAVPVCLKACLFVCACVPWPSSGVTVWFHGSSHTWLVRLFLTEDSCLGIGRLLESQQTFFSGISNDPRRLRIILFLRNVKGPVYEI